MRVTYSIGARFAGGGIGNSAYHAVRGLVRHGGLCRLLCGSYVSTDIPQERIKAMGLASRVLRRLAVYGFGHQITHAHNLIYDRWAARQIPSCDWFHGWGGFCLRSLARAKALGAVTSVERASVHPITQVTLLREEYANWGMGFGRPKAALDRDLAEIAAADYVLIPSSHVRETFVSNGVPERKLIEVPFGVNTTRFRPVRQQQSSARPFTVLFVGHVNLGKGVPYLLDAWERLDWHDAELCLVGRITTDVRHLLPRYADLTGVRVLGHQIDPVSFYHQADVFAFPSLHEGSALVTYEALACGLPVVTTPRAGSVVRDGAEGIIVPIRDAEALASALERLRFDEPLRQKMRSAARARAEEFTWTRYGDRLFHAFGSAMEEHVQHA